MLGVCAPPPSGDGGAHVCMHGRLSHGSPLLCEASCRSKGGREHIASSHLAGRAQVGKAFIQQYYTVLHSRPKYLHRFYTNNSSLTIGEQDGPPSTTVTGQSVRLPPLPADPLPCANKRAFV